MTTQLSPEEKEFLEQCIPARFEAYGPPTPMYAILRNIVVRGRRYADKVACCACDDIDLYVNADTGYTTCQAHGLQEIGHLRSELQHMPVKRVARAV